MRTASYFPFVSIVLLLGIFVAVLRASPLAQNRKALSSPPASRRPELEYLKAVNSVAPPKDPQLLFLLMSNYSNANLQGEGAEFFSARLAEFGPHLSDVQKALYLSAIGLLRAQHASEVSLLHRIGYVNETIATLDQAKQLSGGKIFVVNWIAGIVDAQFPGYFGRKKKAQEELTWCLENADRAPHAGWMREVYFYLGKLAEDNGEKTNAQDFLRRSGYTTFDKSITLLTPFSEEAATGHAFAPRRMAEIVPHKVYLVS